MTKFLHSTLQRRSQAGVGWLCTSKKKKEEKYGSEGLLRSQADILHRVLWLPVTGTFKAKDDPSYGPMAPCDVSRPNIFGSSIIRLPPPPCGPILMLQRCVSEALVGQKTSYFDRCLCVSFHSPPRAPHSDSHRLLVEDTKDIWNDAD